MRELLLPAAIALCAGAPTAHGVQTPAAAPACSMSAADRAWIERALEAWRLAAREIAGIQRIPSFRALLFDEHCVLTSANALISPTAEGVTWTAAPHAGSIALPDGKEIPVGVTSFTAGQEGMRYFAMSTPSVWEANGVGKGDGLADTMVAVFIHESSHVAQLGPYGARLGTLIDRYSLPDSFSDESLQERFGKDKEFAASVQKETDLFLKAAAHADGAEAKFLAFEARETMRARHARWLVGDDAYFVEAEHIWLTFEGAGQWLAYQWQIHPHGGGQTPADVLTRLTRDPSWVQSQGFAVVLALDRIVGPDWKSHAFGDGTQSVLEMLDAALAD